MVFRIYEKLLMYAEYRVEPKQLHVNRELKS